MLLLHGGDVLLHHPEPRPQRIDLLFAQDVGEGAVEHFPVHALNLFRHVRVDLHLGGEPAVEPEVPPLAEGFLIRHFAFLAAEGEVVVERLHADLAVLVPADVKVSGMPVRVCGERIQQKHLVHLPLIVGIRRVDDFRVFSVPKIIVKLFVLRGGLADHLCAAEPVAPVFAAVVSVDGDRAVLAHALCRRVRSVIFPIIIFPAAPLCLFHQDAPLPSVVRTAINRAFRADPDRRAHQAAQAGIGDLAVGEPGIGFVSLRVFAMDSDLAHDALFAFHRLRRTPVVRQGRLEIAVCHLVPFAALDLPDLVESAAPAGLRHFVPGQFRALQPRVLCLVGSRSCDKIVDHRQLFRPVLPPRLVSGVLMLFALQRRLVPFEPVDSALIGVAHHGVVRALPADMPAVLADHGDPLHALQQIPERGTAGGIVQILHTEHPANAGGRKLIPLLRIGGEFERVRLLLGLFQACLHGRRGGRRADRGKRRRRRRNRLPCGCQRAFAVRFCL